MHEQRKWREYGERIRNVEHGDFTPMIVATTGGIGYQGTLVLKRLGVILAEKINEQLSVTMSFLRCRLSFAILKSAILCLRGSRPLRRKEEVEQQVIDLAVSEVGISLH